MKKVRFFGNDAAAGVLQSGTMAGKSKSRAFIQEWMRLAGLKQSDLIRLLGYSKAKANAIWHAEQRLNEDIIEELAPLLNARPYELLMHPDEAHQFRRLQAALRGVNQSAPTPTPSPQAQAPPRGRKAS